MAEEKTLICKTKGCNNPVINGNYCEYCKQKRKENRNKVLAVVGAVAIFGISAVKGLGSRKS